MKSICIRLFLFPVLALFPWRAMAEPNDFFGVIKAQTRDAVKKTQVPALVKPKVAVPIGKMDEARSEFVEANLGQTPSQNPLETLVGIPKQLDVLLGASACIAQLPTENGAEWSLNVSDASDGGIARNQVFCHALSQSFLNRKPVAVKLLKSSASASIREIQAIEIKDYILGGTAQPATLSCSSGNLGCSGSVRVVSWSLKEDSATTKKLCQLNLQKEDADGPRYLSAYIPYEPASEKFTNHTSIELCSMLAMAKFSGKPIEVIGSLDTSNSPNTTLRIYAVTYRYSEEPAKAE